MQVPIVTNQNFQKKLPKTKKLPSFEALLSIEGKIVKKPSEIKTGIELTVKQFQKLVKKAAENVASEFDTLDVTIGELQTISFNKKASNHDYKMYKMQAELNISSQRWSENLDQTRPANLEEEIVSPYVVLDKWIDKLAQKHPKNELSPKKSRLQRILALIF